MKSRNLVNQYVKYNAEKQVEDDGKTRLGMYASNGIELMRVKHNQPTGVKVEQIKRAQRAVVELRELYAQRRNVGTTDELRNIRARAESYKAQLGRIELQFKADMEELAEFRVTRAEFIRRWAGHNEVGLYNSEVLVTELNTGTTYYVQF